MEYPPWATEAIRQIAAIMRGGLPPLAAFMALVFTFELITGADRRRYLTRNFVTDLAYNIFYRGGFYVVLVYAPLLTLVRPDFTAGVIASLPLPVGVLAYWLSRDLIVYWVHRLQHANPVLWEFHKVHHAQEHMTLLTTSRFHVVDQVLYHVIGALPLWLILGDSPDTAFVVYLATEFILFVQHAELPWRYGPLHYVIVSPAFHAIHHSIEAEHHDRNFGMLFSFWDVLFGTAIRTEKRPARFGVEGWTVRESFFVHLIAPFTALARRRAAAAPPAPAPAPATAQTADAAAPERASRIAEPPPVS